MLRTFLLATAGILAATTLAHAGMPATTPLVGGNALIGGTARPLVANRPIFATTVPPHRAAVVSTGRTPPLPPHRRPPAAAGAKNGSAPPSAAATAGRTPTTTLPAVRNVPPHRRPLGW